MSLNLTTISKLESLSAEQLNNNDLFWISHPDQNNRYISKNTSLTAIAEFTKKDVEQTFSLSGMNVAQMNNKISDILSGNITFYGNKVFSKTPTITGQISGYESVADTAILTKENTTKLATDLIANGITMIASDSKTESNPDNNTPYTNMDGNLLTCIIKNGNNESTEITCTDDGQLVVYGWTADNGRVLAQEAWIAIYGYVDNKWMVLQLHPWIVSQNSSILQYIGFNIPVKRNLKIKIKTGFPVNMTASGFNNKNTLTFNNGQINTFVGYIIKK